MKAVISVVALALLSTAMPYRTVQAQEQENGVAPPAVEATDSKPAATGEGVLSAPVADISEGDMVQNTLAELIHAYEMGDVGAIQSDIDPTMLGYQRFLDSIRQDVILLRQIRVHLFNTQTVVGPDVAVIQTDWEKRFLAASNLTPGMFTGHSIFLMHRGKTGWQMAAISGDNLFASQSGTLGQINVVPVAFTLAAIPPGGSPLQIEVIDPDLANRASLTVQATTSQGDQESVVLTSSTPGRFVGSINVLNDPAILPNSGVIEVMSSPATIYIRYLDNNPGNNRPPSQLTRVVPVR